jgi:acyl-CoA thioesterase-1
MFIRQLTIHLILLCFSLGFLFSPLSHSATLLILGDSLSAGYGIDIKKGWVNLLQQQIDEDHTIINGSISGDTTGGGLSRLPALLAKHQPDYLLIELGGNDGLRGYPLNRIKQNIASIIKLSRAHNAQAVLLEIQIPPNYGKRYTEQFRRVYKSVAKEESVALIPFMLEEVMLDKTLMQEDGIHPNEAAQPIIAQATWQQLAPILDGYEGE